jgi:demethylmenaquinone methyltransferase / 2-methoxy-6-polyprenyl-1,4-benzoquinol methylase
METQVQKRIWHTEGAEKREALRRMFGQIAPRYDLVNSLMSLSLHKRWRAIAVQTLQLRPGDNALDVCCGTGDFMLELRKAVGNSGKAFGIDFCAPMLALAKEKGCGPVGLGDACSLPVQTESVDAVTVGWGIRNVPDIDAAHHEIARVLRPGGRFVSIDMALPRQPVLRKISTLLFQSLVPKLGTLFGRGEAYTYLPKSLERFWSRDELAISMRAAGMVDVGYRDLFLGNICIHFGTKS